MKFFKRRYSLEVMLSDENVWRTFYSSDGPFFSPHSALTELYHYRAKRWDFASDKPKFRLWDLIEGKPLQDFQACSLRELGEEVMPKGERV